MATSQRKKKFVWTQNKELQLIQFFKNNPCLWDLNDGHYDNKEVKEERLRQLGTQLGGQISPAAIRSKFKQLQLGHQRARDQELANQRSSSQSLLKRWEEASAFLSELQDSAKKRTDCGRNNGPRVTRRKAPKLEGGSNASARGGKKTTNSTTIKTRNHRNKSQATDSEQSSTSLSIEPSEDQEQPGTSFQGSLVKNSPAANSRKKRNSPIEPVDGMKSPRFVGLSTFARLPRLDEVDHCDVAIVGIPFDAGTSYRPGARFGPAAIRAGSRLLRPYNPGLQVAPFETIQVADCGDIAANPFKIDEALAQMTSAATTLVSNGSIPMVLGGDHTVALPMLRVVKAVHGPVALLHFDAHLDTWDTYFGALHTHGTVFRRATEEGLLDLTRLTHVGIRGPLYSSNDLKADAELGFAIISTMDVADIGVKATSERIRRRIGDAPLYISVDIDVLDPAHAPGTGTPEAGGLTSRELIGILRELAGCNIVGADLVEVSPAYDHAEVTALAAAAIVYELVSLIAVRHNLNVKS